MTDHVWVHENLDSYLAGDMTTGEREKVERHIDVCDTCKHALAEAHRVEQMFGDVFVDAKPSATLDDRVIENVRNQALRSVKMPMAWRIAGAAAAVLVIGMVGWVAQTLTSEGGPFPEANNLTAPLDAAKTTLNAPSAAVYAESKGADQGYAKELAAGYSDDKLKSLADGLTVEQKREVAAEKTETVKVPDGGKGERGGGAAIIPTGGAGKTNTGWAGKEFALERRESFFGTTPANKAPAFPERPLLNTFDTPSLDPMKATRDTKDVTKLEKVLEESMKKGDKGFDGEKLKLSLKVAQLDTTKFFPQTTTLPTGPANIPGTPTFPPALMPVPSISPPPPGGGVPPFPPVDPGSFAKKKGGPI